jgi:hypothetical protein
VVGCDENPIVPPPPGGTPTPLQVVLEWQHPLPLGNDLYRLWGFSDGSFDAVGDAGTVLHFDGSSWTFPSTPVREDLHGIWASGPDDLYACGFAGTLIHFNGSSWSAIHTPTKEDLYAVWAVASNDVFVAGTGGSVWNGVDGSWTEYSVAPGRRFRALWGYSHDEVYAAGSRGGLYRFDGTTWTRVIVFGDPYYEAEVLDLWGPATGTISLLDRYGIQWFNGTAWNASQSPNWNANGLWGFSLDQQFAVAAGTSTRWVDGVITSFPTPTEVPLYDVWGRALDNLYAAGRYGTIAHFDGAGWTAMNAGALDDLNDLWMTGTSGIAVGDSGRVLQANGSTWSETSVGSGYDLDGVWDSGDGLIVAVGRYTPDQLSWRDAILTNSGGGWTDAGPVGAGPYLFDVWGSTVNDVYAVGWAGEILHYDGALWNVVDPGSGDAAFLKAISGTSSDNVIAVGRTNDLHGLVCRFDGSTWTKTQLNNIEELCGVWVENATSAFAVGTFGAIQHFDGSVWQSMSSPTSEPLFCVWGSSSSDIYAAGWEGAMVHYDGSSWRQLLPATNRSIHAISGRSANQVYFAGDKGTVLFFPGL